MINVKVGPVESAIKAVLEKALPVGGRATGNLGSPADMAADVACTGDVVGWRCSNTSLMTITAAKGVKCLNR